MPERPGDREWIGGAAVISSRVLDVFGGDRNQGTPGPRGLSFARYAVMQDRGRSSPDGHD
jgi:hypothetical protein